MTASYQIDLRDIDYALFTQLRVAEKLGALPHFSEFDRETYGEILRAGGRLAEDVLQPINRPGDLEGCTLDGAGNVRTPTGFAESYAALRAGGWTAPTAPPEYGGGGLPMTIAAALTEMWTGSAPAFMMYPGLAATAGELVLRYAPEPMRERIASKLFSGEWGGTMCLTESGAGSAVGQSTCVAEPGAGTGEYHLRGEKIFISAGDQDLTANVIHLVLARTPGAPAGTAGLSLFLVPKHLETGERNGVIVTGIEHKMGLNGSSTCTLSLGAEGTCAGWLMGEECGGIRAMFKMMNAIRLVVASQAVGIAACSYAYALDYARERVQGVALREMRDPASAPVPIVRHPDVRRMLMELKVYSETMRALLFRAALYHDISRHGESESERDRAKRRVDLLIPMLKGYLSEVAFEQTTTALQVFGGYGYTKEFPIEQVVRDAKIMSIYEGTTGIQAMDLLGRKMALEGGRALTEWVEDSQEILQSAHGTIFSEDAERIRGAVESFYRCAMTLGAVAKRDPEPAMLYATPFMRMFGIVALALEALDQAVVSLRTREEKWDRNFLKSKRLNLSFFCHNLLPISSVIGSSIESLDVSALDSTLFTEFYGDAIAVAK